MMNINGMTNIEDVTNMIKDTIDSGDLEGAKDYLDQLNDYLKRPMWTLEPSKSEMEEGKESVDGPSQFMADARDQHQIMKKGIVR
tara:strand:+ start:294 stop:548 length:255 start_codon:yes stop_codon:yes gene_type:complete